MPCNLPPNSYHLWHCLTMNYMWDKLKKICNDLAQFSLVALEFKFGTVLFLALRKSIMPGLVHKHSVISMMKVFTCEKWN